jgi:N-acetylglucosamine kinase-like BadF-type ATPase
MTRVEGQRPRQLRAPAAAVPELGPALRALCGRARIAPSRIAAMVVASRGLWTRSERRRVERALSPLAHRVRVISDAQAAWEGALGGGAGLLILAGTGSIVVGRNDDGAWGRAGGLGPLLGDEGSAFWIGREWLRVRTAGLDIAPARAFVHAPAGVARIAALAPRVIRRARQGDRTAARIVRAAQQHLARCAAAAAKRLALRSPVRVSWAGSLLVRDAWFRAGLEREVARAGLRARWTTPVEPAAAAALRLAEAWLGEPQLKARRASRSENAPQKSPQARAWR